MSEIQRPSRDPFAEFSQYIEKMKGLARMANIESAHHAEHPLLKTLITLNNFTRTHLTSEGLRIPNLGHGVDQVVRQLFEILTTMSMYGYDRMNWLADNYFSELETNQTIQKFISTRLPNADQYDATISELMYWGWLKSKGFSPKLTDEDGTPDLFVGKDINDNNVYCEVKSLLPGVKSEAIQNNLNKANRQIKHQGGDAAIGYCLFRIVEPVRHIHSVETTNGIEILGRSCSKTIDVIVPPQLQHYVDMIHKHLQSLNYRSITRVIFLWEEQEIVGNIPGWITACGTRKSISINHQKARHTLDLLHKGDLLPKATVAFNINIRGQRLKLHF